MVERFGLEVELETWRVIYERFLLCLLGCAETATSCYTTCRNTLPVPPNRNIEPCKRCLARCTTVHSNICLPFCDLQYEVEFALAGRAPGGHGNPEQALNEMKQTAKSGGYALELGGQALVIAGLALGVMSGGAVPAIALALRTMALLVGLTGVAHNVMRMQARRIADDPPSAAFRDMWLARRFELDQFVPEPIRDSEVAEVLLPLVANALLATSMSEAVAESLDRAAGARAANDTEAYFAQLRVSQGYARALSQAVRRMRESRVLTAEKLRGFTIDASGDDLLSRLSAVASHDDLRLLDTELGGNELIIAYDDVVAVVERWRADGLDQSTLDAISRFALDERFASDVAETILSARPYRIDYDRPIADILLQQEFMAPETNLINAFEQWGNFYRS